MASPVKSLEIDEIRKFTGATNDGDDTFTYYDEQQDFRFFRYSQEFPSDSDFGKELGQDKKVSGIQLQTVAQCLINFFGYSQAEVEFDSKLYGSNSIPNNKYKSISALSRTIGEIQNGKGNTRISTISPFLKLQIIRRYAPDSAKNKTNQEILKTELTVAATNAEEQIGVVGPVTYNFILRQSIFRWFKETYLSDTNSFLFSSLPVLRTSWLSQVIGQDKDYYLFIADSGIPDDKPYPTIGVLFDDTQNTSDAQLKIRASQIINFLLLRNTQELISNNLYQVKADPNPRPNAPIRKCVYVDFAEVLYSAFSPVNFTTIDMVKAGLSYLKAYKPTKFLKSDQKDSTVQSIRDSISYAQEVWNGLDPYIDEAALYFTKTPSDMQKMLLDDGVLFNITNQSDQIYTKQYDLKLNNLLSAHANYTEQLSSVIESERTIKRNVSLRNYPSSPFKEPINLYYDKNYNLLGASITRGPTSSNVTPTQEKTTFCITEQNNQNLIIPPIKEEGSLLELLPDSGEAQKYKNLNGEIVIFITEFFIREYAIKSQQYTNDQDLYEKIKSDITNALPDVPDVKKIPNKKDFFLSGDYSRIKFDYLYCFSKENLLNSATEDVVQTQLVKLKTSNFWTAINNIISDAPATFDGFLSKHYPWIEHKANEKKEAPPPPSGTTEPTNVPAVGSPPQPPEAIKFERLKTDLLAIPNEIDLSTKLKIDDLLTGDCFLPLFNILTFPIPNDLISWLDKIFTILNSLDWCYIADLLIQAASEAIKELIADESLDQEVRDSIARTLEDIKECLPAKPPIVRLPSPSENPEDTFRIACSLFFQNFPKIPSLFSLDFLSILKKIFFEFVLQLILELIVQFLNASIKGLLEICKDNDTTAEVLTTNAEEASELPRLPTPADLLDDEVAKKCAIIELLSANPNITKTQIYNVTRQYFGYADITNSEFDTFFSGLTSVLYTNEIINIFTDNISQTLYGIIKSYSQQKQFENFNKIFSNISTTRNFFKFLSKYVDLSPCYKKVATDKTKASYCFDPKSPNVGNLSSNQAIDLANDLIKQITDLCGALSGEGLEDKIFLPSLLDEKAKSAVAAGANAIIDAAYGNFKQMKKAFFQSYATIQVFNKSVNNQSFAALNEVKSNSFKLISPDDALIRKIAELSGENKAVDFTDYGQVYYDSKISIGQPIADTTNPNVVSFDIVFDAPENNQNIIDGVEKFIYDKSVIEKDSKKFILPPVPNIIASKETTLSRNLLSSLTEYTAQQFVEIFFDEKRFNPNLKNANLSLAKKEKNYYYLYDNFLNDAQGTANLESLKRYIDVKNELEIFLK